jgi:4-diphosphocytidyl-2-C-methyl-D-erythritol kinase
MLRRIQVSAYAKINLGLSVLGRRKDGFHELRTVYQSISLADRLEIHLKSGKPKVRLHASGNYRVPLGRLNLAVRAAELLLEELALPLEVDISLEKEVPPGSGLGGGSSDAAAVLRSVPALCGRLLTMERLLHLAASLGSDVPFFLVGGRAVGVGRGEEVYPLPEIPRRHVVIFFPGEGMETSEAYRLLRRPVLTVSNARPTIEVFCGRTLNHETHVMTNDFELLLFRRLPQLAEAKGRLADYGAELTSVSGSGSALFGLFKDAVKARRAAQVLSDLGGRVWIKRTVSRSEFARRAT